MLIIIKSPIKKKLTTGKKDKMVSTECMMDVDEDLFDIFNDDGGAKDDDGTNEMDGIVNGPTEQVAPKTVKTKKPRKSEASSLSRLSPEMKYFSSSLKGILATMRFNTELWTQNKTHRTMLKTQCKTIYACPIAIPQAFPLDSAVFVLEMNNDENKIMGIGMFHNREDVSYRSISMYNDVNNNRYVYLGCWRIDVEDMDAEEKEIIRFLEGICFHGKSHLKIGMYLSIVRFPVSILYQYVDTIHIHDYIRGMFNKRIQEMKGDEDQGTNTNTNDHVEYANDNDEDQDNSDEDANGDVEDSDDEDEDSDDEEDDNN